MYFPYVRGRQFELLALRELVTRDLLSPNILPIIEPVKLSSTLLKTMEEFIKKGKKIGIICNPIVGAFYNDMGNAENDGNRQKFLSMLSAPCIVKSHIMGADSERWFAERKLFNGISEEDCLVICDNRDYVETYLSIFENTCPQYVLIPDEFRRKIRRNKVLFEDKFEKCERNSDYSKNCDEFFFRGSYFL